MLKKRFIGIDFGLKRTGLAISDPFGSFALPIGKVDNHKDLKTTISLILQAIQGKGEIEQYIIGLPLHLDGSESDMSLAVRTFAKELALATSVEPIFIDERLTSKGAEALLRDSGGNRKQKSGLIDSISASLILQTYLDRKSSL